MIVFLMRTIKSVNVTCSCISGGYQTAVGVAMTQLHLILKILIYFFFFCSKFQQATSPALTLISLRL